jgi:hypothetical protein
VACFEGDGLKAVCSGFRFSLERGGLGGGVELDWELLDEEWVSGDGGG